MRYRRLGGIEISGDPAESNWSVGINQIVGRYSQSSQGIPWNYADRWDVAARSEKSRHIRFGPHERLCLRSERLPGRRYHGLAPTPFNGTIARGLALFAHSSIRLVKGGRSRARPEFRRRLIESCSASSALSSFWTSLAFVGVCVKDPGRVR
jgi:hypothetical protein